MIKGSVEKLNPIFTILTFSQIFSKIQSLNHWDDKPSMSFPSFQDQQLPLRSKNLERWKYSLSKYYTYSNLFLNTQRHLGLILIILEMAAAIYFCCRPYGEQFYQLSNIIMPSLLFFDNCSFLFTCSLWNQSTMIIFQVWLKYLFGAKCV